MQDGKVCSREEKKAGASESSGSSWRCAAAERPKEAKTDFQKPANWQDSPDRPNPLTELEANRSGNVGLPLMAQSQSKSSLKGSFSH